MEARMSNIKRIGELDIEQDMDLQRRDWKFQHAGRFVMLLLVIAALLGAFGRGWLAKAEVGGSGEPLRMEYDRIARHRAYSSLKLSLAPHVAPDGRARLWLKRDYLEGVSIEDISPEPENVEVDRDGLIYEFVVADPAQPSHVVFHIKPDEIGLRSGAVGLAGQKHYGFTQFVLP
jgi:hypothetical protein